jgi:hypothetical protein
LDEFQRIGISSGSVIPTGDPYSNVSLTELPSNNSNQSAIDKK